MKRVVVTGLGAVTPVGNDGPSTWDSLVRGRSGAGLIQGLDASGFPVRIAAEVEGFSFQDALPRSRDHRFLARAGQFGVAAAHEALGRAGLREARYAQRSAASTTATGAARPATPPAVRPVTRSAETVPADAGAGEPATVGLCGHRSMNGRTCTREQGHTAKNHRYS